MFTKTTVIVTELLEKIYNRALLGQSFRFKRVESEGKFFLQVF
jgi:hypothetical protein